MDCDPERIWKIVENHRQNVQRRRRPPGSAVSLFDHLHDCYVECTQNSADKSSDKRFRSAVNLLQRVPPEHARPSLIVNLRSDEEGYSFMLCPSDDGEGEEIALPYEDNEIFSYLDNQEIPPVLLEVLEKTQHCHMYSGCVVCEVRDYRSPSQMGSSNYNRHLLLLRPTTETILATVNEIAQETKCSPEEKLFLESRLLLATQPPVCLEPSTDVVCVTNRLQYNRRKFHTPSMRRYLRRRSQAHRSRMHMVSEGMAPEKLRLHDFILQRTTQPIRRDYSNCWKKPRLSDVAQPCNPEEIAKEVFQCAEMLSEPPVPAATLPPPLPSLPPAPPHLQQPARRDQAVGVTGMMAPSAHTMFADGLLAGSKVVQREEQPLSVQQAGVQTVSQRPPPPSQQIPPTVSWAMRIPLTATNPVIRSLIRSPPPAPSRKVRPIVPAVPSGMTTSRLLVSPSIQKPTMLVSTQAGSTGVNVVGGLGVGSPGVRMPPLQVVRGPGSTVVCVSRVAGSPGQPAAHGYVSVTPVSTRRPISASTMTPPLKPAPTSVRTATPSPPILQTPPKLRPSNLPTPAQQGTAVHTSMPTLKLLPQEPLKQPQPLAPLPAMGKSPTPTMPVLKKIASPQPTLPAGSMQTPPLKASPLLAKQPSKAEPQSQNRAKSSSRTVTMNEQ